MQNSHHLMSAHLKSEGWLRLQFLRYPFTNYILPKFNLKSVTVMPMALVELLN